MTWIKLQLYFSLNCPPNTTVCGCVASSGAADPWSLLTPGAAHSVRVKNKPECDFFLKYIQFLYNKVLRHLRALIFYRGAKFDS